MELINPTTILLGTPEDDYLTGRADSDLLVGVRGNDTFLGLSGNDLVFGETDEINVLGLTLETDLKIKYIGTYRNSIEQTGPIEINFNRWNGTNGSATLNIAPAQANLTVNATGNNTFRMLGTLQHQENSWNIEANCLKYNSEIPSINCSYKLLPIKTDVYNETITGEISLSRHVYDCIGDLPYGIDSGVQPPIWCGFYPY